MSPLLEVADLSVSYNGVPALTGIAFNLRPGEALAVLGPNGAGKSSLLKAIIGLVPSHGTALRFADEDISKTPAHRRARRGIGYVPEGRRIFPGMTVTENLAAASRLSSRDRTHAIERTFAIFPQLAERRHDLVWQLSGGQQQMVAVGRALALQPRLLLLDEPTLGLAPIVADELLRALQRIRRDSRAAVIMVEQNVAHALRVCERGVRLTRGRIAFAGSAAELKETYGQVD